MTLKKKINHILSNYGSAPDDIETDIITAVAEWLEERGHYESTFKLLKESENDTAPKS